jgi:Rod binding domain-containing protein
MRGIHGPNQSPGAFRPEAPPSRLVGAAHEFEAQMMKELLKPMSAGNALGESQDDDEDAGSSGALGEFASETLGRALSEAGGLGIADSIMKSLSQRGNGSNSAQQKGKSRENLSLSDSE